MCGIVGIARFNSSGLFHNDVEVLRQMLVADSLRGVDGTGIVRVKREGVSDWRKIQGNPFDLFRAQGVIPWLNNSATDCDRIVFAHNRLASVGSKSNSNAHPFEHGPIVLVHNGFIANSWEMQPDTPAKDFDVDSEALCWYISQKGVEKALPEMKGAYSIVFYNQEEKTLNFYRNAERPMFYGFDLQNQRLVFGSEPLMVEWIMDRNKLAKMPILELPTHHLMTFTWDATKPKVKEIKPKVVILPPTTVFNDYADAAEFCNIDKWLNSASGTYQQKPYTPPPPPPVASASTTIREALKDLSRSRNHPWSGPSKRTTTNPDRIHGYSKGSKIQFVALQAMPCSDSQEQYKILGGDPQFDDVDIVGFTKTKAKADAFVDTALLEGEVRTLEIQANGRGLMFVSNMKVLCETANDHIAMIKQEETAKTTQQAALLLAAPDSTKH